MGLLEKVSFVPKDSVTFQPNNAKQQVDLVLQNGTEKPVMYKMKSTRPGLYKMRPVYDVIAPGESKTCKLIFKGLKKDRPPMKDRFSVVYTVAPSATAKVDQMWKKHKYHAKMVDSEIKKKHLAVLYTGVNDHLPLFTEDDDDKSGKAGVGKIRKGKGLIDEEPAAAPNVLQPPTQVASGPKVMVMFRQQKSVFDDDSDTDDNVDDEDDEKKGTPTAATPLAKKTDQKK